MLGKAKTLPLEPQTHHFALVILEMESHKLFAQAGQTKILLISNSQVARIIGVGHWLFRELICSLILILSGLSY
jgi:hypothetical protein